MRAAFIAPLAAAALAASVLVAGAQEDGRSYSAGDLLSPCQEADNDARWGAAAEAECEQYIMGFHDALAVTGMLGPEHGICPPRQNTADEIRWAFMRWVHARYSERRAMPAGEALLATLKHAFPCSG